MSTTNRHKLICPQCETKGMKKERIMGMDTNDVVCPTCKFTAPRGDFKTETPPPEK